MARKASSDARSAHGFNDIIGIVLIGLAALLLVALVSYHPRDVPKNGLPTNSSIRNWIGPFGAWMAYFVFFWIGAAAYELPAVLFFLGLGCFFDFFSYLRRRWIWTVVLIICCIGLLDLYRPFLTRLEDNLRIMAGGVIGRNLNLYLFGYFGTVGASILFLMLFFISVLLLTNFQFGNWIRATWRNRRPAEAK